MKYFSVNQNQIAINGFTIIENIYTANEVEKILQAINQADTSGQAFRKSANVFAVRQFLKEIPATKNLLFNDKLNTVVNQIFGSNYFVVKSIYFDKPEQSNWFVAYHQDLTISVNKKASLVNYGPWTVKQNQFSVQPPLDILENIFTVRIHLDDTDENNGALKVIPKSHVKNIYRPETIDWKKETETICQVKRGGIMIMKPLLLHASNRTTNNSKRRVIHIEFSNKNLPAEINWAERFENQSK